MPCGTVHSAGSVGNEMTRQLQDLHVGLSAPEQAEVLVTASQGWGLAVQADTRSAGRTGTLFPATQPGSALALPGTKPLRHLATLTHSRICPRAGSAPQEPALLGEQPLWGPAAAHGTSSFCETKERAPGSRLEAAKTSLSSTSFFSRTSRSPFSLRSRSRFLKPVFCCTSLMALVNFW